MSGLWRAARPNRARAGMLALVALRADGTPARAWRPFTAVQLFGGRRWSLSIIRSGAVAGYGPGEGPVDRQLVDDALELLHGEHNDVDAATAALKQALGR